MFNKMSVYLWTKPMLVPRKKGADPMMIPRIQTYLNIFVRRARPVIQGREWDSRLCTGMPSLHCKYSVAPSLPPSHTSQVMSESSPGPRPAHPFTVILLSYLSHALSSPPHRYFCPSMNTFTPSVHTSVFTSAFITLFTTFFPTLISMRLDNLRTIISTPNRSLSFHTG